MYPLGSERQNCLWKIENGNKNSSEENALAIIYVETVWIDNFEIIPGDISDDNWVVGEFQLTQRLLSIK